MENKVQRESYKRNHKLLAIYLAITAWKLGVDCVIVQRNQLLPFLDIGRAEGSRFKMIEEDVKDFFPYVAPFHVGEKAQGAFAALYLSRYPIPEETDFELMSDEDRAIALIGKGLKTAVVEIPTEAEIIKELACMTHGLD